MYHMLEGLKRIVASDKPIRKAQREERIAKLDDLMTRADVADAEKFRRILEAYQIEMDYGTKLGIYQGKIKLDANEKWKLMSFTWAVYLWLRVACLVTNSGVGRNSNKPGSLLVRNKRPS